jgi:hypothetical protein
MGKVVLNIKKPKGNDARTSAHIERTHMPGNADPARTHLNRELITFPKGVKNRTQAIQYRIEHAGIKRKITQNQVRVFQVILSGSPKDMVRIQADGKLDEWCKDTIEWLHDSFGKDNLVSAILHMDEKTPHIHAAVVPIVQGERRKAKAEQDNGKRKYRKKSTDTVRLCADDVLTRDKMILYQDTYAEKMKKYGLNRGVRGSDARHISTQQYYRDLVDKNEKLKEDNEVLQKQKEQANQNLSCIKSEIKTEKLKNTAVDMATSAIEGIGSVFGSSKVKKQQQEIEELKLENAGLQAKIQTLKEQIQVKEKEHSKVMEKLQQELDKIYALFPKIKELLHIENLCRHLGFGKELIDKILEMKPVGFRGKLYSSEYQRYFETEHSIAEIKPEPNEPEKLRLTIDGLGDVSWFRQKYREFQQSIGIKVKQESHKNKGIRL